MLNLGLTAEQHAERRTGIGGSHAPKLMAGNWQEVWLEITGRSAPKKIMSDWNYVLRMTTETLQLDWYEHKTNDRVIRRQENARCADYPFIRATLDGVIESTGEPINAKHVSAWTKEAREWAVTKYVWQIVHEVLVVAPPKLRGHISLIVGEKEPEIIPIDVDSISMYQLIETEEEFWKFVVDDRPPDPNYQPVPSVIDWDKMRSVDLSRSNSWAAAAVDWLAHRDGAKKFDKAAESLREMVEADVSRAYGKGVEVVRNKAGSLLIREVKNGR